MTSVLEVAVAALALGIAAGLAPGALHALVINTALRHGTRAAVPIALAPLYTDLIMIAVVALGVSALPPNAPIWLAGIGGCFLIGYGLWSLRAVDEEVESPSVSGSVGTAFTANMLNPFPWLFWLATGVPLIVSSFRLSITHGISWLVAFYVGLVGVKLGFAVGIGSSRSRLSGAWLRRLELLSVALLVGLGAYMIWAAFSGRLSA